MAHSFNLEADMNDPKMDQSAAKILRDTGCRVGTHVFVWAGGSVGRPAPSLQCNCKLYTWDEWSEVVTPKLP